MEEGLQLISITKSLMADRSPPAGGRGRVCTEGKVRFIRAANTSVNYRQTPESAAQTEFSLRHRQMVVYLLYGLNV